MRVVYYGRELYHAEERAGHRYIARIPLGDKFRYFYDQAELAAYQAGKAMGGAAKAAGKAAEEAGRNIQGAAKVAGRNIQGAANAAGRSASKYMNSASKAIGGAGRNIQGAAKVAGRNIQGAANAAGRSASKHINTAGKAIKNTVTGIKAKAIQRDLEKKGVGKINTSLGDAYKTTSWTQQMYDKQLRDNLVNNKSLRKTPAWMPGKNGPKNNQGVNITTGKNNTPKNNQGVNITTGKNNTPKYNQGIDSKAGSRFMDNVAATSDRSTTKKTGKSASGLYVNPTGKNNAPKNNQGYDSKDKTGKNNAPKNNQGYDSKAKQHAQNDWDAATSSLKKKSKGPNLWAGAETGGKAIASKAAKESKDAQHKKEISDSKRLKNLEKQYMKNYMADGHSAADAKRWAKKAAENYMKKHS